MKTLRENLAAARLDRSEIAGSLGDLGTFLPLLIGMASQNGLDFATALFFAGAFNIVTGIAFRIPMAVQPMKAIAAVALTEHLTAGQIVAAGASVSAIILVLGLTGLIDVLNRVVPKPVVRGLQLALGLSLLMKGLQMCASGRWGLSPGGIPIAIAGTLVTLMLLRSRRVPAALVLFAAGIALAAIAEPAVAGAIRPGFRLPHWSPPSWNDFVTSFPKAALPQIPLTALNSVVAVCALSGDLFPGHEASPRRVSVSVGVMNLVSAWFGAMPMCHGAGGLAGQHRFGARTNGSILFLGGVKLVVAVVFGSTLLAFCAAFPASLLGVMLAFSGLELALVTRDQSDRAGSFAMLVTAGSCLALNSVAAGFAIGVVLSALVRLRLFSLDPPAERS